MDDLEFSVDISDRDWQCFFSQCEECSVLPPSLAGLEDSGMSDVDELGALFAKRVQKSHLNTGLLEEDEPAGSPCEGHPEGPGKHSSGGIESVLSGSEEDIHLQSVNMFFEQMKSSSDSKRTAEQGQVEVIQTGAVPAQLKGGGLSARCTDRVLPKNIPNLNSASRVEAATGIKTTEPVSTIRNTYSVRTDESSSESSTSLHIRHPYLKTPLYIESSPENTANEHSPLSKADRSTPHSNKVSHMDKETCTCNVKEYSSYWKISDLSINPGPEVNSKQTEDKSTQVSQSDTDSTYKPVSKESSPCASVKRKRRKKRRLSVEPVENLFTCERLYDSEDELFTWRRAIDPCFCDWSGLKHQHIKCGFMPPLGQYTLSSNLPAGVEAQESQPKPHHSQYQSVLIQAHFESTGLKEIWPSIKTKGEKELTKVNEDIKGTDIHLESFASSTDDSKNEVRSINNSIFPSAESNDQRVAASQRDRGSTAKLVIMREEAETKKVFHCQSQTEENHQQLETQSLIAYQSSHMAVNMTPPPSKTDISTVTELLEHETRHHAPESADMASEETNSTLHNLSLIPCNLTMDGTVQKLEYPIENGANHADLSPKHEITEVCGTPQESDEGNLIASGDTDQISELQALLENQSRSTSFTTLSSGHTPETEPLPNGNISQTLEFSTLSQKSLQEESTQVISKDGKIGQILQDKVQRLSDDAEDPCWDLAEVAMTNCEAEELLEPVVKSDHTGFAMSSFWKEMEKLTINDILGLRKEKKAQSSFLPSLQETDDSDCFTLSDVSCCIQAEEKEHDQECKDVRPTIPRPEDYDLSWGVKSDTSLSILRENEPVPMSLPPENIYNDKITLNDISGPLISPGVPRGLRRMSRNITVQNLCSLESDPFSYKWNRQSAPKSRDDTCNDIGYLPEDPVPKEEPKLSSMIENFRFSISDIYSYFFSNKQPDSCPEPPIENSVNHFIDGDSAPESYDHFFSDFDTGTFFYTETVKPELVPIFSCSHSSGKKKKFRDAYDNFLVSSSDNSSSESDEEESRECAPIRVVTRFTRKTSSKDIVTDAYENFYTDCDLKEDFFKTTFSFRNININGNNISKRLSSNAMAVRPLERESRSYRIKAMPITVLGSQDLVFPDSVVCNFDDQIITKLQQPLIYENLQTAVANPNLDAPLLPLKQSDMCLICIAFASWVLKTANPQVGDTWKAVLLANVSALSAIRYLRKYVPGETTAGEKKPNLKALSSS